MNTIQKIVKPSGHLIGNRKLEIGLGIFAVLLGCLLLYDAFDARGKKMIWPFSGLAPW